jgi:DNA-binding GntR family transcriptional regulator
MTRAVKAAAPALAAEAYEKLKASIFDFELLPGDRFTETEIAQRLSMSRTPVRDALYRLEREGYLTVHLRVGWSVRPYDFRRFEDFYDLRLILEEARWPGCASGPNAKGWTR